MDVAQVAPVHPGGVSAGTLPTTRVCHFGDL